MAFVGLAIILFLIAGCSENKSSNANNNAINPANSAATQNIAPQKYETVATGSLGQGDVAIELTPKSIENGKLIADIAANTHSVDLSKFDLKQITMLEYSGKKIAPSSAPKMSGHHNSGTLVFDVGSTEPENFRIVIKGIPNVEERVFEWK